MRLSVHRMESSSGAYLSFPCRDVHGQEGDRHLPNIGKSLPMFGRDLVHLVRRRQGQRSKTSVPATAAA